MAKINENVTHDDIDDDDDQLNSSHKIIPTVHQSITSVDEPNYSQKTDQLSFHPEDLIKTDLKTYVHTFVPKDYTDFIQCHVKREKEGVTKSFSMKYSLYFDGQNDHDQILILTARKHRTIAGHSEYVIGIDEESSIAKLKSTKMIGYEYILYDYQRSSTNQQDKPQSLAIVYDEHVFGSKEPRKLTVLLHNTEYNVRQLKENETIIDEWRAGRSYDLIEIKNKTPTYNEESKIYSLKLLNNRIKEASHKNFQLITSNEHNEENVVLQFGRIDENQFALDYRYPFTATEAFAIALTSFHNRYHT